MVDDGAGRVDGLDGASSIVAVQVDLTVADEQLGVLVVQVAGTGLQRQPGQGEAGSQVVSVFLRVFRIVIDADRDKGVDGDVLLLVVYVEVVNEQVVFGIEDVRRLNVPDRIIQDDM